MELTELKKRCAMYRDGRDQASQQMEAARLNMLANDGAMKGMEAAIADEEAALAAKAELEKVAALPKDTPPAVPKPRKRHTV